MIDAPLSLSNLLTVLLACACVLTMSAQARSEVIPVWRLIVPAAFAGVVALMLLAGVFQATPLRDVEWTGSLIVGCFAGHMRGKSLSVEVDRIWRLVRLPRVQDGRLAAVLIVAMSAIDFASAALGTPLIETVHIASVAACCAGFIGFRAMAIATRSDFCHHVELRAGLRR